MYCKSCGKEISDNADVCVHCGVSTKTSPDVVDDGGLGWSLLGCCIPLAGLILFLVWKDVKPNTAKAAGVGAAASVVIIIIFYVLLFLVGLASSY